MWSRLGATPREFAAKQEQPSQRLPDSAEADRDRDRPRGEEGVGTTGGVEWAGGLASGSWTPRGRGTLGGDSPMTRITWRMIKGALGSKTARDTGPLADGSLPPRGSAPPLFTPRVGKSVCTLPSIVINEELLRQLEELKIRM